jgi:3-methyladenine DNA glycosylase AlkD
MTLSEVLEQLRTHGKDSFRKTYLRHGVREPLFGVSTPDLKALKKTIKTDDALARELWSSGWYEARVLATMIADAKKLDEATLDAWSRDLDSYAIIHAVAELTGRTRHARAKAEEWIAADDEAIESAGWKVLAHLAMKDTSLPDSYFATRIEAIRLGIGRAKNRVKHEMNNALIAIGLRNDALEAKATAAAREIGKVVVDHGETACVTPDAVSYIAKTRARRSA